MLSVREKWWHLGRSGSSRKNWWLKEEKWLLKGEVVARGRNGSLGEKWLLLGRSDGSIEKWWLWGEVVA